MSRNAARRAARLVRLYPRAWRAQFPDFQPALATELATHRPGVVRDVVRGAAGERLRQAGLIPRRPADAVRSGLALIYAALLPFTALALGLWSQLHTGLGYSAAPAGPALSESNLVLAIGPLVALAALPVAVVLVVAGSRHSATTRTVGWSVLTRPALTTLGALAGLSLAGWIADRSGWYSPAAAALPRTGAGRLVTLWVRGADTTITPAWVRPSWFARMPWAETVAALLAAPAILTLAAAMFTLVLRIPVGRPGRPTVVVATGSFVMMAVSVLACGRWLVEHPGREGSATRPPRADQLAPGHTGWGVVALLLALATAAFIGLRRVLRVTGPTANDPLPG